MTAGSGDDRLACGRGGAPEGGLPAVAPGRCRLTALAAAVAAPALLAVLFLSDPSAAQQAYGDGPLVLRPPAGVTAGRAPVAGQTVTAGGNVIVNLNAIGGAAATAGADPYGGGSSYGGAVQVRPSYVGSAPGNYYNRPPLPGEVPLRDEDPIVLRPPGPDGYAGMQTASRPVLRPPIERRELPPRDTSPAAATPATTARTATATRTAAATPATTATARPAPKPAPSPAKPATTQQAAPRQAPKPPASTQTAARSSDSGSAGPALRSTVRNQPASPAADAAATTAAAAAASGSGSGTQTAAATPAPATPAPATPAPAEPKPSAAGGDSMAAASATQSGSPVTLPATSAPAREPPKVPEPPSSATAAAGAPEPAARPAATQQSARATAPDRTLPAVPKADADTVTIDFPAGDAALGKSGEEKLAALAASMKSSDDRLQIRAYANAPDSGSSSSARRLSLSRALSVRSYLIDQGIRSTRIDVRALGDTGSGALDRVDVSVSGRS